MVVAERSASPVPVKINRSPAVAVRDDLLAVLTLVEPTSSTELPWTVELLIVSEPTSTSTGRFGALIELPLVSENAAGDRMLMPVVEPKEEDVSALNVETAGRAPPVLFTIATPFSVVAVCGN